MLGAESHSQEALETHLLTVDGINNNNNMNIEHANSSSLRNSTFNHLPSVMFRLQYGV